MQSALISPNFNCSTKIQMFTSVETYVLPLVLKNNS